jgi:hydrogenase maturation protein HypF
VTSLCLAHAIDTVALSGGVFQNDLLLRDLKELLEAEHLQIWTNHAVPANDGGISFGQAALAALAGSASSLKETSATSSKKPAPRLIHA